MHKGEKLKYKEKTKSSSKRMSYEKKLRLQQSFPKRSHKAERMIDELKHPTRTNISEEPGQISGQN